MKNQKHYTDERQIHAEINAALREANELEDTAKGWLRKIERLKLENPDIHDGRFQWMLDEHDKLMEKATNIRELRLKKLQNTLAAFSTMTLPGMGDCKSVVLQPK